MSQLNAVLAAPGLDMEAVTECSPALARVSTVYLADSLEDVGGAPAASIVVLGPHADDAVGEYRFDVAMRMAARRGVLALVLADPAAPQPTSTSVGAAERYGVMLLRNLTPINAATLICELDIALRGSAELALRRAMVALQRLATRRDAGPTELVADIARLVEAPIELADQPEGALAFPIGLGEETQQWVNVSQTQASDRPELALVGRMLADSLGLSELAERRARDLPVRSRAELLSELLDSSSRGRSELLRRARSLGLPIDGWHRVARIETDDGDRPDRDEIAAFATREELARTLLESVRSHGTWHFARADHGLLLIQMSRNEPGSAAAGEAVRVVQSAIDSSVSEFEKLDLFCGVGSVQSGPTGLITSAAEARAAAGAMRGRGRRNIATAFDGLGLRRTLVEWYASHTARAAVDAVLAPLERMGPTKAESAIRTLRAYLDNHGSLSRTATELHLHRNSVAYRVDRIFAELDVDHDNPDDWLLLELACRARALT